MSNGRREWVGYLFSSFFMAIGYLQGNFQGVISLKENYIFIISMCDKEADYE